METEKMSSEFFRFEDTEYEIPFYKENPPLTTSKISVLILGVFHLLLYLLKDMIYLRH